MRQYIDRIASCPVATECANKACLMRMKQVFNYKKEEEDNAKYIEEVVGSKGYMPIMETKFRHGYIEVICPDFKE